MNRRASTRKPCHGCKRQVGNRPADEVCRDCRKAIDAFQARAAEGEGKELVRLPLPWAPHGLGGVGAGGRDEADALAEAYWGLAKELGVSAKLLPNYPSEEIPGETPLSLVDAFSVSRYDTVDWCFPLPVAVALLAVWRGARRAVDAAFLAGQRDGTNFLQSLAAGNVTIERLNEVNVKLARKVQS